MPANNLELLVRLDTLIFADTPNFIGVSVIGLVFGKFKRYVDLVLSCFLLLIHIKNGI